MKKRLYIIHLLILLVIYVASMSTCNAQGPYPKSGDHQVCLLTDEPYGVEAIPNSTYLWTILPGDGGSGTIADATTNPITVHWESAGTCTLQLEETNEANCSMKVFITVTVNQLPSLVITDPLAACSPGSVDLTTANVTGGSTLPAGTVLTYWSDAEATVALDSPGNVTAAGIYYIKATANCFDVQPVNVTINPSPLPVITGTNIVCAGDLEAYTVTLNTGNSYIWTVVGGNVDSGLGTNELLIDWVSGAGSVSVTEKAGTCEANDSHSVTINALPATSTIFHN